MKLNGNFANVYTPYHDLDYLFPKYEEILANNQTALNGLNDLRNSLETFKTQASYSDLQLKKKLRRQQKMKIRIQFLQEKELVLYQQNNESNQQNTTLIQEFSVIEQNLESLTYPLANSLPQVDSPASQYSNDTINNKSQQINEKFDSKKIQEFDDQIDQRLKYKQVKDRKLYSQGTDNNKNINPDRLGTQSNSKIFAISQQYFQIPQGYKSNFNSRGFTITKTQYTERTKSRQKKSKSKSKDLPDQRVFKRKVNGNNQQKTPDKIYLKISKFVNAKGFRKDKNTLIDDNYKNILHYNDGKIKHCDLVSIISSKIGSVKISQQLIKKKEDQIQPYFIDKENQNQKKSISQIAINKNLKATNHIFYPNDFRKTINQESSQILTILPLNTESQPKLQMRLQSTQEEKKREEVFKTQLCKRKGILRRQETYEISDHNSLLRDSMRQYSPWKPPVRTKTNQFDENQNRFAAKFQPPTVVLSQYQSDDSESPKKENYPSGFKPSFRSQKSFGQSGVHKPKTKGKDSEAKESFYKPKSLYGDIFFPESMVQKIKLKPIQSISRTFRFKNVPMDFSFSDLKLNTIEKAVTGQKRKDKFQFQVFDADLSIGNSPLNQPAKSLALKKEIHEHRMNNNSQAYFEQQSLVVPKQRLIRILQRDQSQNVSEDSAIKESWFGKSEAGNLEVIVQNENQKLIYREKSESKAQSNIYVNNQGQIDNYSVIKSEAALQDIKEDDNKITNRNQSSPRQQFFSSRKTKNLMFIQSKKLIAGQSCNNIISKQNQVKMPFILGKNKSQVDQKLADSLKTLNTSRLNVSIAPMIQKIQKREVSQFYGNIYFPQSISASAIVDQIRQSEYQFHAKNVHQNQSALLISKNEKLNKKSQRQDSECLLLKKNRLFFNI